MSQRKSKKITHLDIRQKHPRAVLSSTNRDYADIANSLYDILEATDLGDGLLEDELKSMAIKVTLYFEDIVSEIGLWASFVAKHKELYGKPLPFYAVGTEYDTDHIHVEDIQLLLWDALLADEYSETMPNPENYGIEDAAHWIFTYLDGIFDDTPINMALYNYFHEAPFASNFYEVRLVQDWYFFDCYLTAGRFMSSVLDDAIDKQMELSQGRSSVAQTAALAEVAFNHRIGPLALKPQEWLAALLHVHGQEDKAAAIGSITNKEMEPYFLESYDDKFVSLRDVDGNLMMLHRTKYLNADDSVLKGKDIGGCIGTFAFYNGEWFLNGLCIWGDIDRFAASFKRERELAKKQNLNVLPDTLVGNFKQLFFFKDKDSFCDFVTKEFHLPLAEKQQIPNDVKNIIMFIPDSVKSDDGKTEAIGKRRGFCVIFDIAEYVKSPDNPMYNREKAKKYFLIADIEKVPGEFVRYAISHNLFPDFAINSAKGYRHARKLTQDNLDFLARTLRRQDY